MAILILFGLTLVIAVLVSAFASRTVLSTAVLFVAAGFTFGPGVLGLVAPPRSDAVVSEMTNLALFAVLLSDGLDAHVGRNLRHWVLPARALLLGLPLTIALNVAVARWVIGLAWIPAALVGIALGPTDPVLAGAIVGAEAVPGRLRSLLNIESGFNDGLAFPLLVLAVAVARGGDSALGRLAGELGLGIGLGVVVPLGVVLLARLRFLQSTEQYEPLAGFAAAVLVFATARVFNANQFLAAFAAGLTFGVTGGHLKERFARFVRLVAEILKLNALLLFGLFTTPGKLFGVPSRAWVGALLILVAVRPATLLPALIGAALDRRERLVAAWFGPKGFSSVSYGLLVLHSNVAGASDAFGIIALVVMLSIVAHSSTDVPIAHWFERREERRGTRG